MATAAAAKETAVIPAGVTQQESYSGTLRGPDGTTLPTDYVSELANPVKRMEIFEEMGQGDDAVHTAIAARRQEICAANWALATEDTSDTGTQILEFVEDNVYPILDDLLRWLGGGALQYGFGCVEPVYQWSDRPIVNTVSRGKVKRAVRTGERRIYLRRLAHLLQTSVYTFNIDVTGELLEVKQHVFDGRTYRRNDIPAEKTLLWTYDRQGDDYWGVPPARHCYKAWKIKQQIEKLNLLHIDKFGVGTPVVEEGPGWQQTDRDRMGAYLKAWRSSANNFILHPNGGKVTIIGDEGKSTMSCLDWVKYYNLAIAKTYLTQQTELGSTETGARALGEVFYDQMGGLVQADCEALGNLVNNALIVPLVRYNFGEQEYYPTFAPSQRVRAGTGVASVLNQLIMAKAVHPRPEDEAYLRDVFEYPAVDLDTLKAEQATRDAQAAAIAAATPTDPSAPPTKDDKTGKPPLRIAAHHDHAPRHALASALADGAPDPAVWGQTTYRTPEFSAWEYGIVRPDVLTRDLDMQATRTAGEVHDVLRLIDAELARQVEQLASRGAAALSAGVRDIAAPEKLRKQLRAVMFAAAMRARDYGGQSVVNEIERQLGPSAIGPQRPGGMYPLHALGVFDRLKAGFRKLIGADEPTPADLHLAAEVDRAVEEEIDRREQSARSAALTALAQAAGAIASVLAPVASTAAKDALIGLSTGRTQSNVEGVVNVGFGIGRSETAQAIADPESPAAPAGGGAGGGDNRSGLRDSGGNPVGLVAKVYSAVMDLGTCDECAKWDGAEFPMDYPEDYTGVQAPNPRCAGGVGRCRCVWIYITDRESVPLVPASKGPEPIRRAS